jgi:hypothetical protein
MLWNPNDKYAGWAADAHPEMTSDELRSMVGRMLDHDANLLWIGHNNPGEVGVDKWEPALSYAVYESYVDGAGSLHDAAKAMIDAQYRLLDACLDLGMRVVFPVGYQIQMGRLWNERHPSELRRDPSGNVIDWGGVSASFYSEIYQRDIAGFYEWTVEKFIQPYREIILMVNLADEPFGGDYSPVAERVFISQHGFGFDEVGEDRDRQRLLGRFQSDYVVEYAKWNAEAWGEVCPDVPCTMSFCGWHGRLANTFPTVPALFTETPDSFHVTFDAYPRDGLPSNPIAETDMTSLLAFLRQIGRLSGQCGKPLWLWSTGNSWGLGQASGDKADIADAIANQLHLAMVPVDAGAHLAGIAVWNYNVKNQGLYLDTNPIVYDPDDMFRKVSATFPVVREIASNWKPSPEDVLLYAPVEYEYDIAGKERALYGSKVYDLEAISVLAKNDVKFNLVAGLDDLERGVTTLISLVPDAEFFDPRDVERIRSLVRSGGKFVGHRELVRTLFGDEAADAPVICQGDEELPDVRKRASGEGEVYTVSGRIEAVLDQQLDCHFACFWRDCLGVDQLSRAYVVTNGEIELVYNMSRRDVPIAKPASSGGTLTIYDRHGDKRAEVAAGDTAGVKLGHHEIALSGIEM